MSRPSRCQAAQSIGALLELLACYPSAYLLSVKLMVLPLQKHWIIYGRLSSSVSICQSNQSKQIYPITVQKKTRSQFEFTFAHLTLLFRRRPPHVKLPLVYCFLKLVNSSLNEKYFICIQESFYGAVIDYFLY